MKKKLPVLAILFLYMLQSAAQKPLNIIPFDKSVKTGKLANGLTYYIKKNLKPENRAELRLVVNAGSVLERDDQQGIAHFVEHMAFNGTKNFPKNELLNYLQKAGVRFGADLNATTSFDFTLYMLPIPANDEKILLNGYKVLRDWAGGLSLDSIEIEKERGIIIEEKRMRQNAGQRMFNQYLPAMTNNSKYGLRVPIGKEEVINRAPRKVFADFYKDWYRPNNMAIIAVGDIDVAKTEVIIRSLFSDLKNPPAAPARPPFTLIKWHTTNRAKIVSDPENTNNILTLNIGLERSKNKSKWTTYNEDMLIEIINALFGSRLQENFVDPKSPITYASISMKNDFFRGYESAGFFAVVKENPAAALEMLTGEILKAKQFGFTQDELDRVKKNFLKKYKEALLEKNKTESASYAGEYVEHFLNQTPSPGIEVEQKLLEQFINTLTLETLNSKIKQFNLDQPAFILFNATDAKKNSISESDLLTAFEKAKLQTVKAYTEKKTSNQLFDQLPTAGKITNREINTDFDATTLHLSNGITVIYKKTNFKNDEVLFRASQWGGATNLTPQEIITSKYFSLAGSLGVGKNKAVDMPKILAGVEANVFMNIGANQFTINGNASAKDIEKFMQLLHLKLTQVNFDPEEFEGMKTNFASQVGNLLKNPSYKFFDTLNKTKYIQSNRLASFPLEAELKALQLNDLKELYRQSTGNLNGAVFTFVGNLEATAFEALLEKYIASIPTQPQPLVFNSQNLLKTLTGKNEFLFKAGKENKSEINHSYYGNFTTITDKEILSFTLLTEILQMQATEKLREEMGSTYSPKVTSAIVRYPIAEYSLGLTVSSLPENATKVIDAFDALITIIIGGEVKDEYLQKAKAQRIKVVETQIKTNTYWSLLLEQQFTFGFDPKNITEYSKRLEEITKEDIISVAGKYLSSCNVLKGIMNPE